MPPALVRRLKSLHERAQPERVHLRLELAFHVLDKVDEQTRLPVLLHLRVNLVVLDVLREDFCRLRKALLGKARVAAHRLLVALRQSVVVRQERRAAVQAAFSSGGGAAHKTSPCHGESPCACPPAPLYWLYIYVTEVHIYAVFFH